MECLLGLELKTVMGFSWPTPRSVRLLFRLLELMCVPPMAWLRPSS
jgi:hypothetical protein